MALAEILKMLTKSSKQPRSAAELRDALAQIDLQELERKVDELDVERRKLLVHGSDAEVVAIGARVVAANLACERGGAAIEELKKRIVEAEQREVEASINAVEIEARKLGEEIEADQIKIDEAADKVAVLLTAVRAKVDGLAQHNRKVATARRMTVEKGPEMGVIRARAIARIDRR